MKSDYIGKPVWTYAASEQDRHTLQLAWAQALHTDLPVSFSVASRAGKWQAEFQRIDTHPVVACEYRSLVRNPLAKREQEIAILLASDWKAGEIADKLGISPHTVETVRRRILAKLGVRGVAGVTKWLLKAGLIDV